MRIDAGRSICLALMLAVMHTGVATAEPQIVWQVENPFRFFLDPADTQVHRATSLSESERSHPVQSAERALSERQRRMARGSWASAAASADAAGHRRTVTPNDKSTDPGCGKLEGSRSDC